MMKQSMKGEYMRILYLYKACDQDTKFRMAILSALKTIHAIGLENRAKVYIASGFFDDIGIGSNCPFSASDYYDIATNTNLLSELKGLNVACFGSYNNKKKYLDFCKNISAVTISLTVYYKCRLHCKLFIITIDGIPVFEIIGSSNLTMSAYGGIRKKGPNNSYNSESDVILIRDFNDTLFEAIPFEIDEYSFELEYNALANKNISFDERMNSVLDIIRQLEQTTDDISDSLFDERLIE